MSCFDLRDEGGRKVFVFQDRPTRRDDVMAFYCEAGSVRPLERPRRSFTMHDVPAPSIQNRNYSPRLRDALDRIEGLVVDGLRHGFFEYSLACEIGKDGRRQLVIRAGKSHKFTIRKDELPR